MQKIIDGELYDTATAGVIETWDSEDWAVTETLMKTGYGCFFLTGDGGCWDGGDGIAALTDSEAKEWCEERGVDADIIARHFAAYA